MKKYIVVVLGGIVHLGLVLAAKSEEPIRIPVAEQSLSKPAPVDAQGQIDQARGQFAEENVSDRLLDGHFAAGAGAYIMKPFFQNNPAFFTQTSSTITGPVSFTSITNMNQHDFDWGMDAAPVIWLGYTSDCGLGARVRWWLFDQSSTTSANSGPNTTINSAAAGGLSLAFPPPFISPLFPIVSNTPMILNSNLKLNVWDFEGTGKTELGRWMLLFSGGFRYAHLSQDYSALQASVNETRPGLGILTIVIRETDLLSSGHNFNGAGPKLALEAIRPIGNSGLSLFANLRGSVLFGQSKQQVFQGTFTRVFSNPIIESVTSVESVRDTVLPVAELELGAEFSRIWGAVRPFIRTGLIAQTWFDAGSAFTLDGNLGFLGLSVTAGLNY